MTLSQGQLNNVKNQRTPEAKLQAYKSLIGGEQTAESARILIVPTNDSTQVNRIKNLFEAKGDDVAVIKQSDMELLNEEFAALPFNKKFPNVFRLIENMQKNEKKTQSRKQ